MARLNKKVKLFIVRLLAEFESPTDAVKQVKAVFNIDVTPQQCEAYDPTKYTGQDLSQDLADQFYVYRRKANEQLEAIPIANKRYRLQRLQNLIDHERYKDNPVLVPKMMEQAAKEMGHQYTNTTKTDVTTNGESLNNAKPTVIELVAPDVKGTNTVTT